MTRLGIITESILVGENNVPSGEVVSVLITTGPPSGGADPRNSIVFYNGITLNLPLENIRMLSKEEESKYLATDREESSLNHSRKNSSKKPSWFSKYGLAKAESISKLTPGQTPNLTVNQQIHKAHSVGSLFQKKSIRRPGQRLLWVDFIGQEELTKLNLSKQEIKRQEVIFEIISTEFDYIEDLETILDVYIRPLRKSKLVSSKDMSIIFSNIEQFMPVNEELFRELEDKQVQNPVVESVGENFLRVVCFG